MQLSEYVLPFATYFAEFLGTFLVVFTASLLIIRDAEFVGSWAWRATGIAFATIASISATSAVSGSHLNPAMSLAFGLSRKMYWGRVWKYMVLQVAAGVAACASVRLLMQKQLPAVEPKAFYSVLDASLVEGIYSAMYCLVALNCMVSLQGNPRGLRNQFFPLAVGFVIIAGGPPCSEVSGGFLNPAITLGFCIVGDQGHNLPRALFLAAAQAAGATAAAIIFFSRSSRGADCPWDWSWRWLKLQPYLQCCAGAQLLWPKEGPNCRGQQLRRRSRCRRFRP